MSERSKSPCGNGGEHNPDCFDPGCPFEAPGADRLEPMRLTLTPEGRPIIVDSDE